MNPGTSSLPRGFGCTKGLQLASAGVANVNTGLQTTRRA